MNKSLARKSLVLIFAVALIAITAARADACSCMENGPPCEAFGGATAVFVGKVVGSKERKESILDGVKTIYDVGEIYFKVEESFVGKKASRIVIHSGTGGGDCGFWFRRGETYLVYAYGESQDKLYTNICTRTRLVAKAEEDLAFLRNLPRKGTGARIYGEVAASVNDPDSRHVTLKPLTGITVKIEGERRTYDATTDAEGNYELTGLEPGKYKVRAVLPDYYYHSDEYSVHEIEVNDRGCARAGFFAQNDSRITGQVMGPEGRPVPKAMVELIRLERFDAASRMEADRTWADEEGRFQMSHIPPGRYLLGVNILSLSNRELPYPPAFYPGVAERSQATIINIDWGQKLTDANIQLGTKLIARTVKGIVLWPDGRPAAGVTVYLADPENPDYSFNGRFETGADGQFVVEGFEGQTYQVQAYGNRLTANGKRGEDVYAEPPTVELRSDIEGVRLLLSLRGRPWDKKEEKAAPK